MAILQFHDEMEEDVRRKQSTSSLPKSTKQQENSSKSRVRRPLNTTQLYPPDYHVDPTRLLNGYIEKEIKFGGVLQDVLIDLDITNRIKLLRTLDKAKREQRLPLGLSEDDDAIFSVSAHNIKISHRDGKEELILRLAIHEIIELSYTCDDDQHIVVVKFGNPQERTDMCQIAVLYCDTRPAADEICYMVNQCFHLVYTEATMQYLDEELREAATGMSVSSTTTVRTNRSAMSHDSTSQIHSNASTPNWRKFDPTKPSFLSQSRYDLEDTEGAGTISSNTYSMSSRSLPRLHNHSPSASEGDLSPAARELLSDYMKELQTKLNKAELKKFAMLIKAWRENKMSFFTFCDEVLELYGPERKYLLPGMRPFLGERESDSTYFESFLERVGALRGLAEAAQALGSRHSLVTAIPVSQQVQHLNFGRGTDEFDRRMADIQQQISNMESTVDVSPSLERYLTKS